MKSLTGLRDIKRSARLKESAGQSHSDDTSLSGGGNSDRVGLQSGPPFSLDADELVGGLRFLGFLQLHVFTVALQCDLTWLGD